jgi:hypothetical protein
VYPPFDHVAQRSVEDQVAAWTVETTSEKATAAKAVASERERINVLMGYWGLNSPIRNGPEWASAPSGSNSAARQNADQTNRPAGDQGVTDADDLTIN